MRVAAAGGNFQASLRDAVSFLLQLPRHWEQAGIFRCAYGARLPAHVLACGVCNQLPAASSRYFPVELKVRPSISSSISSSVPAIKVMEIA